LRLGARSVREPAERMRLAELHRIAAERAKASSGFDAAYEYYRSALVLLPEDARLTHRALHGDLLRGAVTHGFLSGAVHAADALAREASKSVEDPLERAELLRLRIVGLTAADRLGDAIACVREAAAMLGCPLPETTDESVVRGDLLELGERLARFGQDGFADAPLLEDDRLLLAMRCLSAGNASSWLFGDTALFAALQSRMVTITLDHGQAPESGGALVRFGAMYAWALEDPSPAYEVSAEGLRLALGWSDLRSQCRARFGMAFHMSHFRWPLRVCVDEFRAIIDLGAAGGELPYIGFACHRGLEAALTMGLPLPEVVHELDRASAFAHRYELRSILTDLSMLRGVVDALSGRTDDHERTLGESELLRRRAELYARHNVWMLEVAYLFRRLDTAARHARAVEPLLQMMPSTLPVTAYAFYDALARTAASEPDLGVVEEHAARLEVWARSCPENFAHKARLVRAEMARVRGQVDDALAGYAEAAAAAGAQGALVDEATAHELAGRLHSKLGHGTPARAAIQQAMRLFARWGSLGKVDALAAEFLQLSEKPSTFGLAAGSVSAAHLDLLSVMKMVESVSRELVRERLFERLLTLGLEIASAQNAVLVLKNGEEYEARARGTATGSTVLMRALLDETTDVPRSLVRAVLDRAEPIMVSDAQNDPVYGVDAYVRSSRVQSALAIPICRQSETIGVLYLESRLAPAAFADDRARLLDLLSAQMAIALDNSMLFERLETEIQERRRAEDRVRFLADAGMALTHGIGLDAVFQKVAEVAVPFLADWTTVDVLTEDGSLRRAAAQHADARMRSLLDELAQNYSPARTSNVPAAIALRTGAPVLQESVTDATIRELQVDARHGELLRRLGSRSAIAVPLVAHGRRVGALTLHVGGARPPFGPVDVALAQELAERAAISIDRARLEARLAMSEKFEAIGRLAGGVAHDFDNFLAVIHAQAEMLSRERGLGPRGAESLSLIKESVRSAAEVTRQLLAVGRKQIMSPELVRVNDFLRASSDMLRGLAGESVQLSLELGSDAHVIEVDRSQLTQVVVNLVTNARDAMPNGGRIVLRTTERPLEGDRPHVCISVADTGIGIDPRARAHLFEPFYTTKGDGRGTGIGLATVHGIVEQSGGSILVESRPGAGSVFTVCFPSVSALRRAEAARSGRAVGRYGH
jgi:signal transduction histidine kinase